MSRLETSWCRTAFPVEVEMRPCEGKGNGLFARVEAQAGELLFSEDPVAGTAILMFDEARAALHCAHCIALLPCRGDGLISSSGIPCTYTCGTSYCSEQCREEAWWVHHGVLCPAKNPAWAEFEAHARECANEYYILAARAVASLRHLADTTDSLLLPESSWQALPWAQYAARPWWETMRRPVYSSSASTTSAGSRSRASSCHSDGEVSVDTVDTSLDRFFTEKVQGQTTDTVALLRSALSGGLATLHAEQQVFAAVLGDSGQEDFGRLIGLFRINTLAVQGTPAPDVRQDSAQGLSQEASTNPDKEPQKDAFVRGMALYAIQSAMNHEDEPNCFMESDPALPHRCSVRALRPVAAGEELCINYMAGSKYSTSERGNILRVQYSIP